MLSFGSDFLYSVFFLFFLFEKCVIMSETKMCAAFFSLSFFGQKAKIF